MLLQSKTGLILGVANEKSIAWSIAKLAYEHGANLVFSYQNEVLHGRVSKLTASMDQSRISLYECDVTNDQSLTDLRQHVSNNASKLDFIVHCIAFAKKEELSGRYLDTSREGFALAMDISCYSLVAVVKSMETILNPNASIITMSYLGGERVAPGYNVMGVAKSALESTVRYLANDLGVSGIRVNSISSGPIKTLASYGISGFSEMLKYDKHSNPMQKNTELMDVAGTAIYLLSNLSSGVTGENIHVDAGYHVMAMPSDIKTDYTSK